MCAATILLSLIGDEASRVVEQLSQLRVLKNVGKHGKTELVTGEQRTRHRRCEKVLLTCWCDAVVALRDEEHEAARGQVWEGRESDGWHEVLREMVE